MWWGGERLSFSTGIRPLGSLLGASLLNLNCECRVKKVLWLFCVTEEEKCDRDVEYIVSNKADTLRC